MGDCGGYGRQGAARLQQPDNSDDASTARCSVLLHARILLNRRDVLRLFGFSKVAPQPNARLDLRSDYCGDK